MWSFQLVQRARVSSKTKKCTKSGKNGSYAKCCLSIRRMNHTADGKTYNGEVDDWTSDRIHSFHKKVHSMAVNRKNGPPFYITTLLVNKSLIKFIIDTGSPVNKRPIKFIIDTCSPVTLITKSKFDNITVMKPVTVDYRDVNDNKTKFEGKTTAFIETDGIKQQLEPLITSGNYSDSTG